MAWQDYIGSYSREYVPAEVLEQMATSHLLGIFIRIDSDPGMHVWLGVNDIPAGFDGIDPEDETIVYLGGGRLFNIPTLEVLVNGQSGSVQIGFTGVDPVLAQRAIEAMPDVRGKDVKIGITTLDVYYQPTSRIISVWSGTASHTRDSSPPVVGTENPSSNLGLAVVSGNNTRSRSSGALWSSAHQKADYPTDLGCDQTARLARGVQPPWPDNSND